MKTILTIIFLSLSILSLGDTKGLNQIVTTWITPQNLFSYSIQSQNKYLGNGLQSQLEFGISPNSEFTYWQGYQPKTNIIAYEQSLYNKYNFQLSLGSFYIFDNRSSQPFICGSYTLGRDYYEIGAQNVNSIKTLLGFKHDFNEKISLLVDYMTGKDNFSTIGFNYNITKDIQVSPAIYCSNLDRKLFPYFVVSYNIHLK